MMSQQINLDDCTYGIIDELSKKTGKPKAKIVRMVFMRESPITLILKELPDGEQPWFHVRLILEAWEEFPQVHEHLKKLMSAFSSDLYKVIGEVTK